MMPLVPAAFSEWHFPQPAETKIRLPATGSPAFVELEPPQPEAATATRTTPVGIGSNLTRIPW